ncbi:MAG: hypothetical protein ABIT38_04835 [Gemmatimonadaceae bacterium]
MMRRRIALAITALASLMAVGNASAQGTLSTQGFGYPLGGLSTRSAALGGASAEFDQLSTRNPAALGGWVRSGLYVQYDPEFRSVSTSTASDKQVTPRFGAVAAGFVIGTRLVIGASSNSFLDRSFATTIRSFERLGGDSVLYTEKFRSSGAIGDTRLGASYSVNSSLAVGVGLHLYTGENRLRLRRLFDDSTAFGTLDRTLTLSYTGTGISAGMLFTPVRGVSIGASMREGGSMKLRIEDTVRTEAKVPNRYGVATRLDFIPGLTLYGSADHTGWSRMNSLGSSAAVASDSWDYAGGVEFAGQKARGASWTYGLGFRQRDLPFHAAGSIVTEKMFSGGTSVPLSGGRATLDLALQRALRDARGNVRERAWLLSVGITVRP